MKRPDNWDRLTGGKELTEIAAILHQIASGARDGYITGETIGFAYALKIADENWEPPLNDPYDNAVRAQCWAAMDDWERFVEKHIGSPARPNEKAAV